MTSVYWLIAFVVFVGIEAATMALTTIWFAGGAFIAFLVSLFGVRVEIQLIVFVIASFLLLFLTRPFASRYLNQKTLKTNSAGLIGHMARVTEEIGKEATGTAVINGQEWTAVSADEKTAIPVGSMVRIKDIEGVKLVVEKVEEDN